MAKLADVIQTVPGKCVGCHRGCNSCGKMIHATHMGYNRPENCHCFLPGKANEGKETIGKIQEVAQQASTAATASSRAMKYMAESISEINSYSNHIGTVLQSIETTAFQTNLLASNAAVEAARVGYPHHGRRYNRFGKERRTQFGNIERRVHSA